MLGTIGPVRNGLPAAEVEVGLAWIADWPEAGGGPISRPLGHEDWPALDLANWLWQRRPLWLLGRR